MAFWHDGTPTFAVTLSGPVSILQCMINGPGFENGDPEDPQDPHWITVSNDAFAVPASPVTQGIYEVDFQTDGGGGPMGFDNNGPWYFGLDAGAPVITHATVSQGVATTLDDGDWHNLRDNPYSRASGSVSWHVEDHGTGLETLALWSHPGLKTWDFNTETFADETYDLTKVKCAVVRLEMDAFDVGFSHEAKDPLTVKIDQVPPKFTHPKSMKARRMHPFTVLVHVADPRGQGGDCSRLAGVVARITWRNWQRVLCNVRFPGSGQQEYRHSFTGRLTLAGTYKVQLFSIDEAGNVTKTTFPLHIAR